MKNVFIHYPACGTCKKAAAWLKENGVEVEQRHIVDNRPTVEELAEWIAKSGVPVKKWFNTSGQVYRSEGIKEKIAQADESEMIALLATNGKLVKRPVLISDKGVLVGFKAEIWAETLL